MKSQPKTFEYSSHLIYWLEMQRTIPSDGRHFVGRVSGPDALKCRWIHHHGPTQSALISDPNPKNEPRLFVIHTAAAILFGATNDPFTRDSIQSTICCNRRNVTLHVN